MWIFENKIRDFLYIYLPGLLTLVLFELIQSNYLITAILSFLVFNFVDVGHVYSTVWRTIFDKVEYNRSKRYLYTPIILVVITFSWIYFKIPYFWSFVGYFTLYHNLRQGFGITKWYEKKNENFHKFTSYIFYGLTYLPLIMFHFRNKNFGVLYYADQDIFLYTNHHPFNLNLLGLSVEFPNVFMLFFSLLYLLIFLYWIIKESMVYNKLKKFEYNRIFFMLYFFFIYFYSFLLSKNILEMTAALVMSHGIPYFFMMHYSLLKTRKEKFSKIKSFVSLFIIAFIGGMINFLGEEFIKDGFNYMKTINLNMLEYVLVLFYVVPVLCHFIWDAYIWRGHHPDAKIIYNKDEIYEK